MIWASLCAIFLAMLLIRLGALTVMVIVLATALKALISLVFVGTAFWGWKYLTRRRRKWDHLIRRQK